MSMTHHDRTGRRPDPAGWMAGVAAFVLWGLLPAYWKGLQDAIRAGKVIDVFPYRRKDPL